jgi:arabinose-5-phosphate isomerase
MGDALAVALLDARGFTDQEFAKRHPSGSLGRQLMHVEELMRTGPAVPSVHADTTLREGLKEVSSKGLGMTVVVDDLDHIIGVFTDGDLRRAVSAAADVRDAVMRDVMTPNPKHIGPGSLAAEAVRLMEQYKITALPVADEQGKLIGALNIHDLFRAGVV